jgi:hypothetical protein
VYAIPNRVVPVIASLHEIAGGGNKEVKGELLKALGSLIQYTNTEPKHRPMVGRRRWHVWKREIVKAETGSSVQLLSFGEGATTQVRIYAVDVDGMNPPRVVALLAYYKRDGDQGLSTVGQILKDLEG